MPLYSGQSIYGGRLAFGFPSHTLRLVFPTRLLCKGIISKKSKSNATRMCKTCA